MNRQRLWRIVDCEFRIDNPQSEIRNPTVLVCLVAR